MTEKEVMRREERKKHITVNRKPGEAENHHRHHREKRELQGRMKALFLAWETKLGRPTRARMWGPLEV